MCMSLTPACHSINAREPWVTRRTWLASHESLFSMRCMHGTRSMHELHEPVNHDWRAHACNHSPIRSYCTHVDSKHNWPEPLFFNPSFWCLWQASNLFTMNKNVWKHSHKYFQTESRLLVRGERTQSSYAWTTSCTHTTTNRFQCTRTFLIAIHRFYTNSERTLNTSHDRTHCFSFPHPPSLENKMHDIEHTIQTCDSLHDRTN